MTNATNWYHGFQPRPKPVRTAARQLVIGSPRLERSRQLAEEGLAQAFVGLTATGAVEPNLFPLQSTGAETRRLRDAAQAFLAALTPEQRADASFPLASPLWRAWSNVHVYIVRHGVCLDDLTPAQREPALALVAATLSAEGFATTRNVMRLNYTIGEITGSWDDYGEWYYWLTIFGTPSPTEPWGWQLDGHHLNLNCLVLGDQIALTPAFMGSEPVLATSGQYAGTRVFEAEEGTGIALMRALNSRQADRATIGADVPREVLAGQFQDNLVLPYEGIRYDQLTGEQQGLLRAVIETYVGRLHPAHAAARRAEVQAHLAATHFAWRGAPDARGVFYYRVHSPVILIEFDHLPGVALDNDQPSRNHIHSIVRTPNGNDYGKDLLRQHYARHPHTV